MSALAVVPTTTPTTARAAAPPRPAPARGLLSFSQLRRGLGISRWTLSAWIADGRFPAHTHELPEIKSTTQRRRWDVAVFEAWTEARRLGRAGQAS